MRTPADGGEEPKEKQHPREGARRVLREDGRTAEGRSTAMDPSIHRSIDFFFLIF